MILTETTAPVNGQAEILLSTIYQQYLKTRRDDDPLAYIPICWNYPGGEKRAEYYSAIDDAVARINDLRLNNAEVFFGVAPRVYFGGRPRLFKKAIPNILTLHVDLDGTSLVDERKLLETRPTALVRSGKD